MKHSGMEPRLAVKIFNAKAAKAAKYFGVTSGEAVPTAAASSNIEKAITWSLCVLCDLGAE